MFFQGQIKRMIVFIFSSEDSIKCLIGLHKRIGPVQLGNEALLMPRQLNFITKSLSVKPCPGCPGLSWSLNLRRTGVEFR